MKKIISYGLLFCFFLFLSFGSLAFDSSKTSLLLWFEKLVPSMFVSMVLIRILYKQQCFEYLPSLGLPVLFRMDKDTWNLVLCTMFLGFPTGSSFIDEAVKKRLLSSKDAKVLLYCCCFPTPGFVFITCGIVFFHSLSIGILLFILQILSGLLLLLFTPHSYIQSNKVSHSCISIMGSIKSSIIESGVSLYMIGGYFMLFTTLTTILFSFFPSSISFFFQYLAEFSNGISLVGTSFYPLSIKLQLTSFILGFGGFCVHMQIMNMVEYVKLNYFIFLCYRVAQGVLSLLFLQLYMHFFSLPV